VKLLLDTNVLIWWLADDPSLSQAAREAISGADRVAVSAASAWEIAIKRALGKLEAPDDLETELDREGFERLSISVAHALRGGALPLHHTDPFDRLLVAQAELDGLTLVTRDERLAAYGVAVLPA
jgi:PIN domain nuclease of toxin-antitoxin system